MSLDASEAQQLLATRSALAAALDQMDALCMRLGLLDEADPEGQACPRCGFKPLDELDGSTLICPGCNANIVAGKVVEGS